MKNAVSTTLKFFQIILFLFLSKFSLFFPATPSHPVTDIIIKGFLWLRLVPNQNSSDCWTDLSRSFCGSSSLNPIAFQWYIASQDPMPPVMPRSVLLQGEDLPWALCPYRCIMRVGELQPKQGIRRLWEKWEHNAPHLQFRCTMIRKYAFLVTQCVLDQFNLSLSFFHDDIKNATKAHFQDNAFGLLTPKKLNFLIFLFSIFNNH